MASSAPSSLWRSAPGAIARHRLLSAAAILLLLNLSALVDKVLHPDIPYFDSEHIVVGGVTALCAVGGSLSGGGDPAKVIGSGQF